MSRLYLITSSIMENGLLDLTTLLDTTQLTSVYLPVAVLFFFLFLQTLSSGFAFNCCLLSYIPTELDVFFFSIFVFMMISALGFQSPTLSVFASPSKQAYLLYTCPNFLVTCLLELTIAYTFGVIVLCVSCSWQILDKTRELLIIPFCFNSHPPWYD